MKSDDPINAARVRASNAAHAEKKRLRREKSRNRKMAQDEANKQRAAAQGRIWIPKNKRKLQDYRPGPVTINVAVNGQFDPNEAWLRGATRASSANPASDEFLRSYEWRRVRMIVLKRDGAKCRCCGATPADGVKVNVDHIKPRKLYPQLALNPDNCQVLCEDCNHGKGNWDMTDWREKQSVGQDREGRAEKKG